jgi:PAS domain-containing protein
MLSKVAKRLALILRRALRRPEQAPPSSISSGVGDASVLLTLDWRFAYVDLAATEVFQKRVEDLVGRIIWEAVPELRESRLLTVLRTAAEQKVAFSFEEPNWMDRGSLLIYIQPVDDGLFVTFSRAGRKGLVPESQGHEAHPDQQQKQDARHQDV